MWTGRTRQNRNASPIAILIGICLFAGALMLWAAWTDSPVNDEVAHIPAGYDYVRHFTDYLNPEHPPLVKALAAASILFLQPTFPTSSSGTSNPTANEWLVGTDFLYGSGNNADMIVRTARIVPIAITLLTIIVIYFLSRMLMGPWWSLAPSFLFALDPTILANGHYVTTDVGAAFGIVTATYYFFQHLRTRSKKSLWFAGIAFGIAQLTKFSTIILLPFFFLLYLVRRMDTSVTRHDEISGTQETSSELLRDLVYIFLIGYGIVYFVYALFTINYPMAQQVADTTATLHQWLGGAYGLGSLDVWMAGDPILRPFAQYLLGLLMVASHVVGGVLVYAFGRVSLGGGWWYFPAIFTLKEPIPILIIIAIAMGIGFKRIFIRGHEIAMSGTASNRAHSFWVFALLSFAVAYWSISTASALDHGIRYLIPTFPFIYILAAYAWSVWLTPGRTTGFVVFGGLLLWLLLEMLLTAPYFLSYYNEVSGGTWNGYHWATDSNYDWGQDLLRFQTFMNQHPEISSIAVGNLGRGDVHYYLGDRAVDWSPVQGDPANAGIHWLAISIDSLELATQPLEDGLTRNASDAYSWLTAARTPNPGMGNVPTPDFRIGTSIFVYYISR